MSYDSTIDTKEHIARVAGNLNLISFNLSHRSIVHDASKLKTPEKEAFDILTPRLKNLQYGSEEYRASLRELKPALEHHYQYNSHHPEHWPNGVADMSLMDILEMLADWKAAGERHVPPNSLENSIAHNAERFHLSPELTKILFSTARELNWIV
jgi:hypothetical protein